MKKLFLILAIALMFQSQVQAQDNEDDSNQASMQASVRSPWYLGISLGAAIPAQDWDSDYSLGGGGVLSAGYRLNSTLALQVDLNPWFFTGGGNSIYDTRTFCDLRFNIPGKGFVTYFLIGPGYDVQVDNPSGYYTSTLAMNLGLGLQFDVHPGEHIFLESRYNILFYNNLTQQDVPILFGLMEDL
jgi:opacity protein-like surface antigen